MNELMLGNVSFVKQYYWDCSIITNEVVNDGPK